MTIGGTERPTPGGPADRPPTPPPGQEKPTTPPGAKTTAGAQNLMFEIVVFANNQLSTYHVNAKTREVKQFGTRVDLTRDRP
jgi:hypothetical protein